LVLAFLADNESTVLSIFRPVAVGVLEVIKPQKKLKEPPYRFENAKLQSKLETYCA